MSDAGNPIQVTYRRALRCHRAGDLAEAERLYRHLLTLQRDQPDALHGLGMLARRAGRIDQAIELIRRAIASRPDLAEYHTNLGNALYDAGEYERAVEAHARAIALNPQFALAYNNLGRALWSLDRRIEAVSALQSAVALGPGSVEALTNLGNGLREIGRSDEAVEAQRRAIQLRPDVAELHLNLGNTLALRGELDEAIECYRRAVALRPDSPSLHSQLILTLPYHPECTAEALREELARWDRMHAEPSRRQVRPHANDRTPDRRLRVGLMGGVFRSHVCALLLEPLLRSLDRDQFEVFCYSTSLEQDVGTARFKALPHCFRDVARLGDEQLAGQVRDDRIDILLDLHLHTAENRLPVFARKPAPVQATWLGYPGSTGLSAIDYRFTDAYLDPPGVDESLYTERSVWLPTFWCYGPDGTEPPVGALPAVANGHITFGCLNNFCKINDDVLALWRRVLEAVSRSKLMVLCDPGSHRARVVGFMASRGIDPGRIRFEGRRVRREYLDSYNDIDVALDTLPYAGHTTTLDATWMGVPVVTLAGRSIVSRGGVSILTNTGVPELIAHTAEQYVQIAADLTSDLARLNHYRGTLRARMAACPTTDARAFARAFGEALRRMWAGWCNGG